MEAKISVLMSVCNESIQEFKQAADSILGQTVSDFEFIVVDDNPNSAELAACLEELKRSDTRVTVLYNETNIGLAMSMDRAAQVARGKYLARMDADDISHPQRLETQYTFMEREGLDLSCTWFRYINAVGEVLDRVIMRPAPNQIKHDLPYYNTIHHPTVMIKKTVFDSVGGYRDFPCSQDYDLWLRLYETNCSMSIVEEELLDYRINPNGVSQTRRCQQAETICYIQKLFRQRQRCHGEDAYSKENYERWMERHHIYDQDYLKKAAIDKQLKDKIDEYRGKPEYRMQRYYLILKLFVVSPFYRRYFLMLISNKIRRKLQIV